MRGLDGISAETGRNLVKQLRYDSVIALGFDQGPGGALTPTLEKRVQRAIHHHLTGNAKIIVMSGGRGPFECCSSAEAMRKYAIRKGVLPSSVIEQRDALDTVGEAVFTRLLLPPPLPGRRVLIVTSDFHARRALMIFRFVYEMGFEIEVDRVTNVAGDETRSEAQETESLQRFHTLFANTEQGDLTRIVELLWTRHVLYQGAQFSNLRQRTEDALRNLKA